MSATASLTAKRLKLRHYLLIGALMIAMAVGFFSSAGFVFATLLFIILSVVGFYLL